MIKAKQNTYKFILSRRSIRRFKQVPVPLKILKKLGNAARLAPSGANLQPLEFLFVNNKVACQDVFKTLIWAGYISPNGAPKEGQMPVAYVLVLVNTTVRKENYQYDVGAAMENMILTAREEGIGSCWIGSINRIRLGEIFGITEDYIIDSVLALGYCDEYPIVEELKENCKYWKDQKGKLHVPKRRLDKITHFNKFKASGGV